MSDNIKEVLEQYEPPKSENKPESNVQKTTNVRKLINDYKDTVEFNLKEQRKKNLEKLKASGINVYPYSYKPDYTIQEVLEKADSLIQTEQPESEKKFSLAGRILGIRGQGKTTFIDLWEAHFRLQLYLGEKILGESYEQLKNYDLGDYIGVTGELFKTRMGELTLRVRSIVLLAKSLQPFPVPKEKIQDGKKIIYDEFSDKETRYRKRYLDLVLNQKTFQTFQNRSKIIKSIRDYMETAGYLDVETPTLQSIYGGANAQPFETQHKALGLKLYLRISNELFLKRCIIGGFHKVYEIVKDFRNEGIDKTHNPEFTMLEFYEAYADYNDMMLHFENIYREACLKVHQKTSFNYDGTTIDLAGDWQRLPMKEAIQKYAKIDVDAISDIDLAKILKDNNIEMQGDYQRGIAICEIFEYFCPQHLIQPTFITDHPKESTPLCKLHRKDTDLIERFEPYIMGWEVGNAYSELNDPVYQKQLLLEQEKRKGTGEIETHPMDEDFIQAMEYGMPPTGGIGLGIDRMVMLLTDQKNIRDVILFPLLKLIVKI